MSHGELPHGFFGLKLEDVKARHIMRVWEDSGRCVIKAAETLGVGRATMYRFVDKYKLPFK